PDRSGVVRAVRASGAGDARTRGPSASPRGDWRVPARAEPDLRGAHVDHRRAGAALRERRPLLVRGDVGLRLQPRCLRLRGARAEGDLRCGVRGVLRERASMAATSSWLARVGCRSCVASRPSRSIRVVALLRTKNEESLALGRVYGRRYLMTF